MVIVRYFCYFFIKVYVVGAQKNSLVKILQNYSLKLSSYTSLPKSSGNVFFFFFYSVLRPFQDYFSSYETGQSVGGAKTGEPREKTPGTPASRTWLDSHVAKVGLKPTPDTAVR